MLKGEELLDLEKKNSNIDKGNILKYKKSFHMEERVHTPNLG